MSTLSLLTFYLVDEAEDRKEKEAVDRRRNRKCEGDEVAKQGEQRNGESKRKGHDGKSAGRFINPNKRLEPLLPCRFQTIAIPKRIRISLSLRLIFLFALFIVLTYDSAVAQDKGPLTTTWHLNFKVKSSLCIITRPTGNFCAAWLKLCARYLLKPEPFVK